MMSDFYTVTEDESLIIAVDAAKDKPVLTKSEDTSNKSKYVYSCFRPSKNTWVSIKIEKPSGEKLDQKDLDDINKAFNERLKEDIVNVCVNGCNQSSSKLGFASWCSTCLGIWNGSSLIK